MSREYKIEHLSESALLKCAGLDKQGIRRILRQQFKKTAKEKTCSPGEALVVWLYTWFDSSEKQVDDILTGYRDEIVKIGDQLDIPLADYEKRKETPQLPDYWLTVWDNKLASLSIRDCQMVDLETGEFVPYDPKAGSPLANKSICLTKLFLIGRADLLKHESE